MPAVEPYDTCFGISTPWGSCCDRYPTNSFVRNFVNNTDILVPGNGSIFFPYQTTQRTPGWEAYDSSQHGSGRSKTPSQKQSYKIDAAIELLTSGWSQYFWYGLAYSYELMAKPDVVVTHVAPDFHVTTPGADAITSALPPPYEDHLAGGYDVLETVYDESAPAYYAMFVGPYYRAFYHLYVPYSFEDNYIDSAIDTLNVLGYSHDDQVPLIGINDKSSPWYKLVWGDGNDSSKVKKLLTPGEDAAPSSFVFPLNWKVATRLITSMSSELDTDTSSGIPKPVSGSLRDPIMLSLNEGTKKEDDDEEEGLTKVALRKAADNIRVKNKNLIWQSFVAAGASIFPLWYMLVVFLIRLNSDVRNAVANTLEDAADTENTINDTMAQILLGLIEIFKSFSSLVLTVFRYVIGAIIWLGGTFFAIIGELFSDTEWGESKLRDWADNVWDFLTEDMDPENIAIKWLFGQSVDEIEGIAEQLFTRSEEELDGNKSLSQTVRPIIHLDPDLFNYRFTYYGAINDEDFYGEWPGNADAWETWYSHAGPALEYAFTLNLSSVILEMLISQDNAVFGIGNLANSDGMVGNMVRKIMKDHDLDCFTEVFNGVSFAKLLRFIWRQHMTDAFIFNASILGYDVDCLYEVFCWMNTSDKRENIDAVLGQLSDDGTRSGGVLSSFSGTSVCEWWETLDCDSQKSMKNLIEDMNNEDCGQTLSDATKVDPPSEWDPAVDETPPLAGYLDFDTETVRLPNYEYITPVSPFAGENWLNGYIVNHRIEIDMRYYFDMITKIDISQIYYDSKLTTNVGETIVLPSVVEYLDGAEIRASNHYVHSMARGSVRWGSV